MKTFTDWYALERYAKDTAYDSLEFTALFPSGPRKGRWIDAYMGCVRFDGLDGFLLTRDLDSQFPGTACYVLEAEDA